jgi:anti-sigma-K factor RskA
MTTGDRMGRAEDYVLGLMDETERARADRDMSLDPEFRDCVLELAHKLQRLHDMKRPARSADEAWNEIATRIAALPQMAGLAARKQRKAPRTPAKPRLSPRPPVGRGLHETGGSRGLVVAFGIAAVFAIGYLVGHLR